MAISGLGAELAIREKVCSKCKKEFDVLLYSKAVKKGTEISDMTVASMKYRINILYELRKENAYVLSMRLKKAQKLLAEADMKAQEMVRQREIKKALN